MTKKKEVKVINLADWNKERRRKLAKEFRGLSDDLIRKFSKDD